MSDIRKLVSDTKKLFAAVPEPDRPPFIVCPLCGKGWTERIRERGSCPGCDASLNEMLRAYTSLADPRTKQGELG